MKTKQLEEKVFSFLEEHHMITAEDKVVAGISGGADSVCLLLLLLEYQKQVPFLLAAVHVNHMVREEADQDSAFVEALCARYGIPFYLRKEDVPALAKEEGISTEEAGRMVRYKAFAEVADLYGYSKIAVAHNANDRAETLLFHLFRGSGSKGLSGIRPVRDKVIRPLLCLERKEIEEYLASKGQPFCEDATNHQDEYTRNRIRHHILPYAEKEIVSGATRHVYQGAEKLAELEDYLGEMTGQAKALCVKTLENKRCILISAFMTLHKVIQKRLLYELINELSPQKRDIQTIHVDMVYELFAKDSGKSIQLPYGMKAVRVYDWVEIKLIPERGSSSRLITEVEDKAEYTISLEELKKGSKEVLFGTDIFVFRLISRDLEKEKNIQIPQNQYTKWFDCAKMKKSLVLRTRKTGDYIMIRDKEKGSHHKTLKDYMVTEKIPREERNRIPILAQDDHVLWLVGYRMSEAYKVEKDTKLILEVSKKAKS